MSTPTAAPRRTAANADFNTATGAVVPGANAQTYIRKPASTDGQSEAKAAEAARAMDTGLSPENVQVNK